MVRLGLKFFLTDLSFEFQDVFCSKYAFGVVSGLLAGLIKSKTRLNPNLKLGLILNTLVLISFSSKIRCPAK